MMGARAPILLVEDEDEIREDLALILREEGYMVVTAANGREGHERLRAGPLPSVVLLDLMMPVMSGWELRAEMLADPGLARIPVVVVSGAVIQDGASLQAAAYLKKPFQIDALLDILAQLGAEGRSGQRW
jgi:CheY-like chemotaxis protein